MALSCGYKCTYHCILFTSIPAHTITSESLTVSLWPHAKLSVLHLPSVIGPSLPAPSAWVISTILLVMDMGWVSRETDSKTLRHAWESLLKTISVTIPIRDEGSCARQKQKLNYDATTSARTFQQILPSALELGWPPQSFFHWGLAFLILNLLVIQCSCPWGGCG